jgi:hypothetical protein
MEKYSQKRQEAVLMTYYKQGDFYLNNYKQKLAANSQSKIAPGEGCRVCLQRDRFLKALGLM